MDGPNASPFNKLLPAIATSFSSPPEISVNLVDILNEPGSIAFPDRSRPQTPRSDSLNRVTLGSSPLVNDIAPWADQPPTPPPKSPRHLTIPGKQQQQQQQHTLVPPLLAAPPTSSGSSSRTLSFSKAGFASFTSLKGSNNSRSRKESESQTALPAVPPPRRSTDGSLETNSRITLLDPSQQQHQHTSSVGSAQSSTIASSNIGDDTRKSKPSMNFISFLKRQRSKSRLSGDTITGDKIPKTPALPLPANAVAISASTTSLSLSLKKEKKEKKPSKGKEKEKPPVPPLPGQMEVHLDTDITQMDGILNLNRLQNSNPTESSSGRRLSAKSPVIPDQFQPQTSGMGPEAGPSTAIIPRHHSASTTAPNVISAGGSSVKISYPPLFSNPFAKDQSKTLGLPGDMHKVSPTSQLPSLSQFSAYISQYSEAMADPGWVAPASWDVEPGNEHSEDLGESSSAGSSPDDMSNDAHDSSTKFDDSVPASLLSSLSSEKKRKRRHKEDNKVYTIKIFLPKHEFRVAQIPLDSEVRELGQLLHNKVLSLSPKESYRVYLKERGRERILASNEKPAKIVRKRLLQAGYQPHDGLDALSADGSNFLVKFEFKTQLLETFDDIGQDSSSVINLEGRGLRTIPARLHQHAESIVLLKLSRNPMLDIPLDFIQSCTSLREVRLQNMALKRIPLSIKSCSPLQRLDMSSNWLSELDEGALDWLPSLAHLFLQNNRLSKLPWYTPRLRSLVTLNLSNNRFKNIPHTLTELEGLHDLDMSFNQIQELSEDIGKLRGLERLILVANQIKRLPQQCSNLVNLRILDVRRNRISDVSPVLNLPKLRILDIEHNHVRALDLSIGPLLCNINAKHNHISSLSMTRNPNSLSTLNLTSLNISHSKIAEFPSDILGRLTSLRVLKMNHNTLRTLPESIGALTCLQTLSFAYNRVDKLPLTISSLQMLEVLEAHHNCLKELPAELWHLASLTTLNVSSNFIRIWQIPAEASLADMLSSDTDRSSESESQESLTRVGTGYLPLAHSLHDLYIAENQLEEHSVVPIMLFKNLRLLNLAYNKIRMLPPRFFALYGQLAKLYLSGNGLTSIPAEDLWRLVNLTQLYLNANMLTSLPIELAKIPGMRVLEVSCNRLRYNINNWEFDWNWNFNAGLISLNLSGNPHLVIKTEGSVHHFHVSKESAAKSVMKAAKSGLLSNQAKALVGNPSTSEDSTALVRSKLSGFGDMHRLCVLGLMDVTISVTGAHAIDIPEETEDRRVRTTLTTVGGMPYGISDSLGDEMTLGMFDLAHEFHGPGHEGESVFAMFGDGGEPKNPEGVALDPRASANLLAKFLHDRFIGVFRHHLDCLLLDETTEDAIRRTYLALNKQLHDWVYMSTRKGPEVPPFPDNTDVGAIRTGAVGVTAFFSKGKLFVANVGDALAVISKQGTPHLLSRKHEPTDALELKRMRACEGWVSNSGLVNEEVRVSRAFGYFQFLPTITAAPDVFSWNLTDEDDALVIANRAFWDIIPIQLAIDIARVERADPMLAAAKLRDIALAHGAQRAIMVMVINVSALFGSQASKDRRPTLEDHETFLMQHPLPEDHHLRRMEKEVVPPTGHLALVFTDIQNSTHLWETNSSMSSAIRIHNNLLRRELRICGGYEVKTEGDAFMVSFSRVMTAVWWCLKVQEALLDADWPIEVLECEDGKPRFDDQGKLIARGLSVRMGVHCGTPLCERDPVTLRMDYFGPIVNRAARVSGCATGGEVMVSAEVLKEIEACIADGDWTPLTARQPRKVVEAVQRMRITIHPVGDIKLKGLEHPEYLSSLYSKKLIGRMSPPARQSRPVEHCTTISIDDIRQLGTLCLRLEALASGRIYRVVNGRKRSAVTDEATKAVISEQDKEKQEAIFVDGDDRTLLPPMDNISDQDLVMILDSFAVRIQNTLLHLAARFSQNDRSQEDMISRKTILSILQRMDNVDPSAIQEIISAINAINAAKPLPTQSSA